MSNTCAAIDENILDRFKLKPNNCNQPEIGGKITHVSDGKIFVKIDNESFVKAKLVRRRRTDRFNIHFEMSLLPLQMQLRTVRVMKNHKLFSCLINNSQYDSVEPFSSLKESDIESGLKT